ncbi:TolC family protein [Prevotella sp. 10(H)]|uniref:TolC family protein n=1 Tax=Prevotella sp. 10(H) TaxID=1158294 RepID=UPI0004A718EF|nr:TolC family protein [Prevotella sp. 10(H)]
MKFVIILTLLILSLTATGQEKKWTMDECMRYAIENSPKKNKQNAENSIYHQNYLEAIGKLLPSLSANTNVSFNFGRGLDAQTNTYTDINSFSNNYSLYTSLVLFDGLANINKLKMQKVNKLMGKEDLQKTKDDIAYETMEAFITVAYNEELVKLAAQQLEESSANVRQVKRMEELGMKGSADVAELVAKEAADNYNLTRNRNLLTISNILLKEKMNFPIEEELHIKNEMQENLIAKTEETAISIYEKAKDYNPKAKAAEMAFKAQQLSYKATKGTFFPTLSAEAGITTNFSRYMDGSEYSGFKNQIRDKRGHYVGLSLSIPIFSGFSKSSQVKRSKAQTVIARNERDETLRTLYSEIEQAVTDMNGQADEFFQARKQTEAMEIAHNVNQRKFTEGLVSAIELHTSSNRLLQAKVDEVNARLKYELKQKLVNYYKGEPFISE